MTASYLAGARINAPEQKFNLTIKPEPWMDDAACAEVGGNDWFPEGKGSQYRDAKAIRDNVCDVKAECLAYTLINGEDIGIWGGTTSRERRAMRKKANA